MTQKPSMTISMVAPLALVLGSGCGSIVASMDGGDNAAPDASVVTDDGSAADAGIDSVAATCAPVPSFLRARYRAEGNAKDEGGAYNGSASGVTYGPGKFGQAFVFNGSGAITVDDNEQLWPQGSMSLEAWVKTAPNIGEPHDGSVIPTVVTKFACGGQCETGRDTAWFSLSLQADPNIYRVPSGAFRPDNSPSGNFIRAQGTGSIVDGNWHHLVAVRDATALQARLYVDGQLAADKSGTAAVFGPMSNLDGELDPLVIGAQWAGAIDELAIYHSALTAAQVSEIYNAPEGKCL